MEKVNPMTSVEFPELVNERAHERTLLGAIDSYLSQLAHVRPYLVSGYRDVLEHMAEVWLKKGGENQLAALTPLWLNLHIGDATFVAERQLRRESISDFLAWTKREGLVMSAL